MIRVYVDGVKETGGDSPPSHHSSRSPLLKDKKDVSCEIAWNIESRVVELAKMRGCFAKLSRISVDYGRRILSTP